MSLENSEKNTNEQLLHHKNIEVSPIENIENEKSEKDFANETLSKIEEDMSAFQNIQEEVLKIENSVSLKNSDSINEIKKELNLDNELKVLDDDSKSIFQKTKDSILEISSKISKGIKTGVVIGATTASSLSAQESQNPDIKKVQPYKARSPKEYAYRKQMYNDSLYAYNNTKDAWRLLENRFTEKCNDSKDLETLARVGAGIEVINMEKKYADLVHGTDSLKKEIDSLKNKNGVDKNYIELLHNKLHNKWEELNIIDPEYKKISDKYVWPLYYRYNSKGDRIKAVMQSEMDKQKHEDIPFNESFYTRNKDIKPDFVNDDKRGYIQPPRYIKPQQEVILEDKTKLFQGYDFMQQTGLRPGYYTDKEVAEAKKKVLEDKNKKSPLLKEED